MQNIPNLLSAFRILLIPFFIWQIADGNTLNAGIILAVSGVTDLLDGKLARRYGWITDLGKVLDPIADKLTQAAVSITLAVHLSKYLFFFMFFITKDVIMLILGGYLMKKGIKFTGAKWFGKISTVVFYTSMVVIILIPAMPRAIIFTLFIIMAVCASISALMYIPEFIRYKNEITKKTMLNVSIFFMLSSILCVSLHVQGNASDKRLNEYLVSKSIQLTCIMDSLAQSSEYIQLTTGQPELEELIAAIGADEYLSPRKAVLVSVPDITISSIIKNTAGELNLPDDAYEMVVARMCASVPSIINAQQGVNTIAATSILSVSKAFQQHIDFNFNTYVILIYDNYSSVTFFRNSAEGITIASSTFLFLTDDMKKAIAEETVIEFISENLYISGIEIEYADLDR